MLLSVGEIIKKTFSLYGKNWRSILPYSMVIFVPAAILAVLGVGSVYLSTILPTSDLINDVVIFLLSVGSWFISFWAMLALAKATKEMNDGMPIPDWRTGLTNTGNLLLPVLWVSILTSLFVGLWTLLFIIPGIIFSVYYAFSAYVTLFDGTRGRAALKASKALVKGRWWSVAWRMIVVGVVFGLFIFAVIFILAIPFTVLLAMNAPDTAFTQEVGRTLSTTEVLATMMIGLVSSLGSAVVGPLATMAMVLVYLDVRKNPMPQVELTTTPPTAA